MTYHIRIMAREDITQVTEMDREAFPTQWPAANYHHEMQNRLARYIVATAEDAQGKTVQVEEAATDNKKGFFARLSRMFHHSPKDNGAAPVRHTDYLTGFAGFWIMADEAHITSIAVREQYRRKGIGELLFICLIELAREVKASMVTLEVRATNYAAQALYYKYGFTKEGVRRGYYTDNHEDALIMTLYNINSAPVCENLEHLKQEHARKWGLSAEDYRLIKSTTASRGNR